MRLLALLVFAPAAFAQAPPRPCETDPNARAFDFWVGTWDVHTADGQRAGTNVITREEGGCLILERWSGARGGSGTSMNYYVPADGVWKQRWVAAGGSTIWLDGGSEEPGTMRLEGELVARDGSRTPLRGSWTLLDDGRVRQLFEQSADGGTTWTPWFEGFYTKQAEDDREP